MENKDLFVQINKISVKNYSLISIDSCEYVAGYYKNSSEINNDIGKLWTKLTLNEDGNYVEYFSGLYVDVIDSNNDIEYFGKNVCDVSFSEDVFSRFNSFLFVSSYQVVSSNSEIESRFLKSNTYSKEICEVMYKKLSCGRKKFSNMAHKSKVYSKIKRK